MELLYDILDNIELLDGVVQQKIDFYPGASTYEVCNPTSDYSFLHEAAVIEYHGVIFAAWYNNVKNELTGRTPVRGSKSDDGGKTWSRIETYADDADSKIKYCPPVFGICNDTLYMFVSEMTVADHMHALDLYVYDEKKDIFEFLRQYDIPFKVNTNAVKLANGSLMLPGRTGEKDKFADIPAVLLSDSGKIDAEWRLVCIQPDSKLPGGLTLVHPELSAIVENENIIMFCRDDKSTVPLIYKSSDNGESWSAPIVHDIPFVNSKIYSGTLSDGRNYVIGNILNKDRSRLAIFFTKPGKQKFSSGYILQSGRTKLPFGYGTAWHYPCAYEYDGKLYVIYTVNYETGRGAAVTVIDLYLTQ